MTIYKPIKGRVLRVVRLDSCGNALTGTAGLKGMVVSDGFIKADFTPNFDAGVEFIQKNAQGDLCVNEKDPDRLKRMDVKISMCSIDPAIVELMTGSRVISTGTDATGVAFNSDPSTSNFSLEIWSSLAGSTGCAPGAGAPTYFMWTIPWLQNMKVNVVTIDNTPITIELEGNSKANQNYGAGRFGLWNPVIAANEHWAFQATQTAPPVSLSGYQQTP